MKKIMLATDFSERSDRALRRATLLARQFGGGIDLVHVVDDDRPGRIVDSERAEGEDLLLDLAGTLREIDGVDCKCRIVLATPFAGIVQAAEDVAPDLLVLGCHRRQVLRDTFVGTTAERTIRSVGCPVLMVNAVPASPYRQILLTTDLSDGSQEALQRFVELGIGAQSRSSVLHVFDAHMPRRALSRREQDDYLEDQRHDAVASLQGFMASVGPLPSRQIVRHEETTASNEILKAAGEEAADLVVIGTSSRRGLAKLLLGSVAERVLHASTVDVLAIPPLRQV